MTPRTTNWSAMNFYRKTKATEPTFDQIKRWQKCRTIKRILSRYRFGFEGEQIVVVSRRRFGKIYLQNQAISLYHLYKAIEKNDRQAITKAIHNRINLRYEWNHRRNS